MELYCIADLQLMYLNHQNNTIHYIRFGSGANLLFCLHGYGETGEEFSALAGQLGKTYTVICIDLPLHGKTVWRQAEFLPPDLQLILLSIAEKEMPGTSQWALAGYSMGGRLALTLAQHYTSSITKLILLAPDGLKLNFWYWLTTQTRVGNRLFRQTMNNPTWLFRAMKWARKAGLLNQSIFKFSHRYLDDPEQRNQLYKRWTLFRNFRPDITLLSHQLKSSKLPALFFFGNYDRIITTRQGERFLQKSGTETRLYIIEAGHRLLKPAFAATIAERIYQQPA